MPIQRSYLESTQDLVSLLGPRQADIMSLLWTRGPATVRQLLTWLTADPPIAYTTIMTICVRLTEKGLVERRLATNSDESARPEQAYVYAPRISEEEFTHAVVGRQIDSLLTHYPAFVQEQVAGAPTLRPIASVGSDRARIEHVLAYMGMLRDSEGQRTDDVALDTIAALLDRAENAERRVAAKEAEAVRAELRAQAAEQRAKAAERRAEKAKRRLEAMTPSLNHPSKPERKQPVPSEVIIEHRDGAGICRVCGKKAPPQSAARRDDLRVCIAEACRVEARRRDNVAKQRRARARRRARRQAGAAISSYSSGTNNL